MASSPSSRSGGDPRRRRLPAPPKDRVFRALGPGGGYIEEAVSVRHVGTLTNTEFTGNSPRECPPVSVSSVRTPLTMALYTDAVVQVVSNSEDPNSLPVDDERNAKRLFA